MVNVIPKRTFLLKQEKSIKGNKDILAERGIKMSVTEEEAIKFFGAWHFPNETERKNLLHLYKTNDHLKSIGRIV